MLVWNAVACDWRRVNKKSLDEDWICLAKPCKEWDEFYSIFCREKDLATMLERPCNLQMVCVYTDNSKHEPSSSPKTACFRHGSAAFPTSKPTSNYSSFWQFFWTRGVNPITAPPHSYPAAHRDTLGSLIECPLCLQLIGLRSRLESPMRFRDKDADPNAATSLHGCRMEIKPGLVCEAFANLCAICLLFHWKYPFWYLKQLPRQMWPDWGLAECAGFRIQQKVQVF